MKLRNEQTVEQVDPETGEVITLVSAKEYSTRVKPDSFYMTFIDYISPLFKLKSENARKLLTWMCSHAEYNTGIVHITTADRKEIATTCHMTPSTITNNLATLKSLNLISGSSGKFQINPMIFWKGDTKVREKMISELKITFSIE